MTVWLCWGGEYEQVYVSHVAATLEAAVRELKNVYGSPYIVEWSELKQDSNGWVIRGSFEDVPGKSTRHTARYDFEEREVIVA